MDCIGHPCPHCFCFSMFGIFASLFYHCRWLLHAPPWRLQHASTDLVCSGGFARDRVSKLCKWNYATALRNSHQTLARRSCGPAARDGSGIAEERRNTRESGGRPGKKYFQTLLLDYASQSGLAWFTLHGICISPAEWCASFPPWFVFAISLP